jgi:hypothetical protein
MEAFATEWTEWAVHKVLFWEEDPVRKGKIVRYIHHFLSNTLIILVIVSHTLYPAFWLQTLVLFLCTVVWIQHVTCNGCVISKVEQKLIGDSDSFVAPILEAFHLEPTQELAVATVIMGSTLGVFVLGLEWIARVHHKMIPLLALFWLRVKQNGIVYTQE